MSDNIKEFETRANDMIRALSVQRNNLAAQLMDQTVQMEAVMAANKREIDALRAEIAELKSADEAPIVVDAPESAVAAAKANGHASEIHAQA